MASWLWSVVTSSSADVDQKKPKKSPPLTMHADYGYRHRLVHGIVYPPFADEAIIDELQHLDWSRPGDVLVATYPKCGTTWMQQIVLVLLAGGEATKVADPMEQAPWVDRECSLRRSVPEVVEKPASDAFGGRRCFKTHAPYHLLPCADGFSRGKIIVVMRNPKDAAVSMYKHFRGLPAFGYSGPWDHFYDELFSRGKVGHGDYFDHVLGWRAAASEAANVLWLTFEETRADVAATVRRVAAFLEIHVDETIVDNVVRAASFDSMKAAHMARVEAGTQRMGSAQHFRSGTAGGWRSVFTVEQSEHFDALFLDRMRDSDVFTDFGNGLKFRGSARIQ